MKKCTALFLSLAMMLGLAACGTSSPGASGAPESAAPSAAPESSAPSAPGETPSPQPEAGGEAGGTLVVYFSATGNTEQARATSPT